VISSFSARKFSVINTGYQSLRFLEAFVGTVWLASSISISNGHTLRSSISSSSIATILDHLIGIGYRPRLLPFFFFFEALGWPTYSTASSSRPTSPSSCEWLCDSSELMLEYLENVFDIFNYSTEYLNRVYLLN